MIGVFGNEKNSSFDSRLIELRECKLLIEKKIVIYVEDYLEDNCEW